MPFSRGARNKCQGGSAYMKNSVIACVFMSGLRIADGEATARDENMNSVGLVGH